MATDEEHTNEMALAIGRNQRVKLIRLLGLVANILGTVFLVAAAWFETGKGYVEQGLVPYPEVRAWLYVGGLVVLFLGFALQLVAAVIDLRG